MIINIPHDSSTADPVRCSAGRSLFTIYSDGTIVRCWMHDYENCGSVAANELRPVESSLCDKVTCLEGCEGPWITVWKGSKTTRGFYAYPNDNPFNPQGKRVAFIVSMNSACSYGCSYCIAGSNLVDVTVDKRKWLPPEAWIQWWTDAKLKFETCSVQLAGGEPTIFPRFVDIARAISKLDGYHLLTTNLSIEPALEPFINGEIRNFTVIASAHPSNLGFSWSSFIKRAVRVAAYNELCAVIVDTPANAQHLDKAVELFNTNGLRYEIQTDQVARRKEVAALRLIEDNEELSNS